MRRPVTLTTTPLTQGRAASDWRKAQDSRKRLDRSRVLDEILDVADRPGGRSNRGGVTPRRLSRDEPSPTTPEVEGVKTSMELGFRALPAETSTMDRLTTTAVQSHMKPSPRSMPSDRTTRHLNNTFTATVSTLTSCTHMFHSNPGYRILRILSSTPNPRHWVKGPLAASADRKAQCTSVATARPLFITTFLVALMFSTTGRHISASAATRRRMGGSCTTPVNLLHPTKWPVASAPVRK